MTLSEKVLADLALAGLHSSYREKLDGLDHYSLNQLLVKALGQEAKFRKGKDTYKSHRSNTPIVEYDSDSLHDEDKEVYATEFVWPALAKPYSCASLNSKESARRDEVYF